MRRDVVQAIADPTRRAIINMVARESLNVNSVAGNFDVSRTAIYKHVKILTECGLVVIKQKGRERFCEARLDKLHEVSDWVEQYRKFWNARLDALEGYQNKRGAQACGLPARDLPGQDLVIFFSFLEGLVSGPDLLQDVFREIDQLQFLQ
jgi:DNA-binding transcriptional ArsR family regulator